MEQSEKKNLCVAGELITDWLMIRITVKAETFASRKFRVFRVFCEKRESLNTFWHKRENFFMGKARNFPKRESFFTRKLRDFPEREIQQCENVKI